MFKIFSHVSHISKFHIFFACFIFTVRNEVAKVMFLHVSVILSTGGLLSQHTLQVVSQHALQERGSAPRGFALGRGSALGGLLSLPAPGASALEGVWRPPKSRWLLLWTVRILLDCILVLHMFFVCPPISHFSTCFTFLHVSTCFTFPPHVSHFSTFHISPTCFTFLHMFH